jgi:predicted ATP-grasp superfamily ATP-dependent carboligase
LQTVLILDGNQRSALAATRALGRRSVSVVVGGDSRHTLAGASKYCTASFRYPSPYERADEFVATVLDEAARRGVEIIFPMTDISTTHLLRARGQLSGVRLASGELESYEALSDKWHLYELTGELGLPSPDTCLVRGLREAASASAKFGFPVVLKPRRSVMQCNGTWVSAPVSYARSLDELETIIGQSPFFSTSEFLLQQYVEGEGRGVFALYQNGAPVTFFSHRRLRERPPSGGVSVLCESTEVDPYQRTYAQAILDRVKWHGVAMVEFKIAREGTPYLMEVNARFWGSLQLAIDAGVDFPYMLYRLTRGETVVVPQAYLVGIRSRWLLGDLDRLYLMYRPRSAGHTTLGEKWRALLRFLKLYEKGTRYDVNRWDDIRPFLTELRKYVHWEAS